MAEALIMYNHENPDAPLATEGVPDRYVDIAKRMLAMAAEKGGVGKKKSRKVTGAKVNISQDLFTPSQLTDLLKLFVETNMRRTVMIWGQPGISKSAIVAQVAAAFGIPVIDLRLGQLAPTDVRGVPAVDKERGTMKWCYPDVYPTQGRGILFLDEINMASAGMQGIAQQLVLDRKVGNYKVPDGWFIWAAGNRREDGASVNTMPTPVSNRMVHINVQVSFDDWAAWAVQNLPTENNARGLIVSYIMSNRSTDRTKKFAPLLDVPSDGRAAWPSPRSWEMAAISYSIGAPVAPCVGRDLAESLKIFADKYQGVCERLSNNQPVSVASSDIAAVAWMAAALGSSSKLTSKDNQGELDKVVSKVSNILTVVEEE